MRSRRRRLQRQRRKWMVEGYGLELENDGSVTYYVQFTRRLPTIRVWGRPRGSFDHAGKLRSAAR